jgi:hypothetical protein
MAVLRRKALWVVAALLAVNAVLFVAQPGYAVPRGLAQYFFGPRLVRAEIVIQDRGLLLDYRVDKGRVRLVRPNAIRLLERDGSVVTIPVAPDADVTLNGRAVPLLAIRRGMTATTVRASAGDEPAETVQVRR